MFADEVLIRRAEVVRIHLAILEALLAEPLSESQAIRASLSLRFLFSGALSHFAHESGIHELRIPAPDLTGVPIDQALVFACGGYTLGATRVGPYYAYRKPGETSPYRAQFEKQASASPGVHTLVPVKLGTYQKLPCLALLGTTFSRGSVVHYVANKCGGAHHHDDTSGFDKIEHGLTNVGHGLQVNGDGMSIVFLETLGTAWFLMTAPDVMALRSRLSKSTI
jgi:hypothetical protein